MYPRTLFLAIVGLAFGACTDGGIDTAAATADPAGAQSAAPLPAPTVAAVVGALETLPVEGLWPGFSPRDIPVALFDGERTVLLSHPSPPPEFTAAADVPGAYAAPGRHEAVRGNMPTVIGGVPTAAVLLDRMGGVAPARAAATVAHERFHVHQAAQYPDWTTNELAIFQYPATDPTRLFERRLETLALYRAVQARDAIRSECWLRSALLLRRKRMRDVPPAVAEFERGIERQEGLARYIERRAAGVRTPVAIPAEDFAPEAVRERGYVTGEVLAVMLDRYSPGWKERLADGDGAPVALDSLLWLALVERPETSCGFSAAERTEVLERATADVAARRAQRDTAMQQFDAQPGWSIRVIAEAGPLWPQSFDPMSITRVGEDALIHERMLRAGNEQGFIDVFGVRALSTGYADDPLMSGMREVRVGGLAERPAVASGENIRVRIVAPGVELSFTDAHVMISDREIVVRLR